MCLSWINSWCEKSLFSKITWFWTQNFAPLNRRRARQLSLLFKIRDWGEKVVRNNVKSKVIPASPIACQWSIKIIVLHSSVGYVVSVISVIISSFIRSVKIKLRIRNSAKAVREGPSEGWDGLAGESNLYFTEAKHQHYVMQLVHGKDLNQPFF